MTNNQELAEALKRVEQAILLHDGRRRTVAAEINGKKYLISISNVKDEHVRNVRIIKDK